MLNHIADTHHDDCARLAAEKIKNAYNATLSEGKVLTRDLGGTAGTDQFADALLEKITG